MARLNGGGVSKAVAITDTFVVTNVADLITLTNARVGDVGIVTSTNETYILQADPYSTPGNWVELLSNSVIAGGANAGNIAFFNNAYTIIGSNNFNFSSTNDTLVVGTGTVNAQFSYAFGEGSDVLSGNDSLAGGYNTQVTGARSFAWGELSINGGYNAGFGYSNYILATSGFSFIAGRDNSITGLYDAVLGNSNAAVGDSNFVVGNGSTVTGTGNLVAGNANTVNATGTYNILVGQSLSANGNHYNAIFGKSNWTQNAGYNILAGEGNFAGGDHMAIFGRNNGNGGGEEHYTLMFGDGNATGSGSYNLVGGLTNNITGSGAVIAVGISNTASGGVGSTAIFGEGNSINYGGNCIIAGKNNAVGYTGTAQPLYNAVFGLGNTANDTQYGIVAGQGNTVGVGSTHNAVFGRGHIVTGNYNVVGGGYGADADGNTVSAGSNAVFGARNNVSGELNLVSGGGNVGGWGNTVTSSGNLVSGRANAVSSIWGFVSGISNTLAGSHCFAIGDSNNVNIQYGGVLGYQITTSTGQVSHSFGIGGRLDLQIGMTLAIGGYGKAINEYSFVQAGGYFDSQGERGTLQFERLIRQAITTDNTPTEMYITQDATKHINCEDGKVYLCDVKIVARNTGAQEVAGYKLEFIYDRSTNAAGSRVLGLTKTIHHEDVAAWDVDATADTTNGRPAVKVTGENAKTIHWTIIVEMAEVA